MPGPTSDSFDAEFGIGSNFDKVARFLNQIEEWLTKALGPPKNILEVLGGPAGNAIKINFFERDIGLIRLTLNRAIEII